MKGLCPDGRSFALPALLMVLALSLLAASSANADEPTEKGWLGVKLQRLTPDLLEAMDVTAKAGVLVTDIVEDSPAEKAGLQVGDVILKYDDQTVKSPLRLSTLVRKTAPGTKVKVNIARDGEDKTITVEVGQKAWEEEETYLFSPEFELPGIPSMTLHLGGPALWLGVQTVDLTDQLAKYFNIKDGRGVLISEVMEDTPAEKAKIQAGDVIIKADGERIDDTGELKEVIREHQEGEKIDLVIVHQSKEKQVQVALEESPYSIKKKIVKKLDKLPGTLKCRKWMRPSHHGAEVDIEMDEALDDFEIHFDLEEMKEDLEELEKELERIKEKLEMD